MAGKGPPPGEQVRRRNKPEGFEDLPAEGYVGPVPPLPKTYKVLKMVKDRPVERAQQYLKATKEWYEDWARSPMATKFVATDWNRLRYVIAPLQDQYIRLPSAKLAGEIRLQETLLGGTVNDRQRMRWNVGDGSDKSSRRKGSGSRSTADRRARLSVVK